MKYFDISINNVDYTYGFYKEALAFFCLKDQAEGIIKKDFPKEILEYESNEMFEKELHAYFEGRLREFTTPLYLSGTAFQKLVYARLIRVPYGQALSYSDLAKDCGGVNKVRAVSNAVGSNRILILVPCHRIIAKDGTIGGFSSGIDLKEKLLNIEGVEIRTRD